jgi:hypothetical protein
MNMQKLTDKDILDYLMTSEFNEGLNLEEFKFLLKKFRYYYRLMKGNLDRLEVDNSGLSKSLSEQKDKYESTIMNLTCEKAKCEDIIDLLKSRKLSFKERWEGKIILTDYENSRF